jgi:uncharacterized repeat protein (TIGR03803 family)
MIITVEHESLISGLGRRAVSGALALVLVLVAAVVATRLVHAQTYTYTVLWTFTGGGGPLDIGGLVRDANGNLYGTTEYGGTYGYGTVFELNKASKEKVLYSFSGGKDGNAPSAGLVRDTQGNLYGTTQSGGDKTNCTYGCGVVFKVDKTGKETVLHTFEGYPNDGAYPSGNLVRDKAGNLYGTTVIGGNGDCSDYYGNGCGTVFKLNKAGKEEWLYSFGGSDGGDGTNPFAGLLRDAAGNLYGTTAYGGTTGCNNGQHVGCGTVFKVDKTGKETVLYEFQGGSDGGESDADLVLDPKGNLYGTTLFYGTHGYGVVFKLDKADNETVLYPFTGGSDGGYPYAGLVRDAKGNLYGTTVNGGSSSSCYQGCGVVFKVDKASNESVLHSFSLSDGSAPTANLIRDGKGNLYGTAAGGGTYNYGVVFKLTP